jgi:hypothetical protein
MTSMPADLLGSSRDCRKGAWTEMRVVAGCRSGACHGLGLASSGSVTAGVQQGCSRGMSEDRAGVQQGGSTSCSRGEERMWQGRRRSTEWAQHGYGSNKQMLKGSRDGTFVVLWGRVSV